MDSKPADFLKWQIYQTWTQIQVITVYRIVTVRNYERIALNV